ncbi:MAG TPA: aldo/keto reductase [archaeon]|nr:aldo/keto reductase [archaeon]
MDRIDNSGPKRVNRREFLAGTVGAVALGAGLSCSRGNGGGTGKALPRRKLGRTDMNISIIGMGGGSTLSMVKDYQNALALVDLARTRGINLFDSSANYGPKSEGCFGEALQNHRKEVYFSTKYETEHSPDQVMKNVESSLKRLRTDYIDIAHMHAIKDLQELETMFRSGALETLVKLKEQGVIRYIGVTSHNHPPALAEALRRFEFDVCMMGANASKVPFLFEYDPKADGSFEELTLPLAIEQGIGVIAFKITGQRRLIRKGDETDKSPALELIRYGLSLPVHGILLGVNAPEQVISACELACNFTPMTPDEMRGMNERLAPSANQLTLHYLRPDYVDDGGPREHLA